jgi:hypothetical protein
MDKSSGMVNKEFAAGVVNIRAERFFSILFSVLFFFSFFLAKSVFFRLKIDLLYFIFFILIFPVFGEIMLLAFFKKKATVKIDNRGIYINSEMAEKTFVFSPDFKVEQVFRSGKYGRHTMSRVKLTSQDSVVVLDFGTTAKSGEFLSAYYSATGAKPITSSMPNVALGIQNFIKDNLVLINKKYKAPGDSQKNAAGEQILANKIDKPSSAFKINAGSFSSLNKHAESLDSLKGRSEPIISDNGRTRFLTIAAIVIVVIFLYYLFTNFI